MSSYQVSADEANFQIITLDAMTLFEQLDLGDSGLIDCVNLGISDVRFADRWGDVITEFSPSPLHPAASALPDITIWQNGCFVISDYADACLKDILAPLGERLPVKISDAPYYLYNILATAQVDPEKSEFEWQGDEPVDVKKLFIEPATAEGKDLFKASLHGFGGLFCTEGFKETCEEFDLKGLAFS